jgi:hypothetical protein
MIHASGSIPILDGWRMEYRLEEEWTSPVEDARELIKSWIIFKLVRDGRQGKNEEMHEQTSRLCSFYFDQPQP